MSGDISIIDRTWMTSPWLLALALAVIIGRIGAVYFGKGHGKRLAPLSRLNFFFFCIVYSALIFVAFGLVVIIGVGFNIENGSLLFACLVGTIGCYSLTGASVRRLTDIGWSRNWAWLLVFDGFVAPFILVLWLVPGKRIKTETAVSCA
jgi:hypothetical protein